MKIKQNTLCVDVAISGVLSGDSVSLTDGTSGKFDNKKTAPTKPASGAARTTANTPDTNAPLPWLALMLVATTMLLASASSVRGRK